MARTNLTPEQAARVADGLCACGCGEPLPTYLCPVTRTWRRVPRAVYVSPAHRQRGYRQRVNVGAIQGTEARLTQLAKDRAARLYLEAAEHLRRAEKLEGELRAARKAGLDLWRQAQRVEADAGLTPAPTPEV